MGLIGSAVGAVTGVVGGIAAGNALNKGYEQQQKIFNDRISEVKAHRDNLYYQDPTQSAENQAAVTQARQLLSEQNKRAVANNIVTGGTDESVAMAKGQAVQSVGNMMQQQAAQSTSRKDNIWNSADSQIDTFSKYLADSKLAQAQGKAQAIQQTTGSVANAANSLPW